MDDVQNGYLNAALIEDTIKGKNFVKNLYSESLKASFSLTDDGLRIVSLFSNKDLIELFNRAFRNLKEENKVEKLKKKWDLD